MYRCFHISFTHNTTLLVPRLCTLKPRLYGPRNSETPAIRAITYRQFLDCVIMERGISTYSRYINPIFL